MRLNSLDAFGNRSIKFLQSGADPRASVGGQLPLLNQGESQLCTLYIVNFAPSQFKFLQFCCPCLKIGKPVVSYSPPVAYILPRSAQCLFEISLQLRASNPCHYMVVWLQIPQFSSDLAHLWLPNPWSDDGYDRQRDHHHQVDLWNYAEQCLSIAIPQQLSFNLGALKVNYISLSLLKIGFFFQIPHYLSINSMKLDKIWELLMLILGKTFDAILDEKKWLCIIRSIKAWKCLCQFLDKTMWLSIYQQTLHEVWKCFYQQTLRRWKKKEDVNGSYAWSSLVYRALTSRFRLKYKKTGLRFAN